MGKTQINTKKMNLEKKEKLIQLLSIIEFV